MADIKDIAWAAGIYEGEGCFAGPSNNKYIHVVQKDEWLCRKLQSLFGGTVRKYDTHYRWFLYGIRARGFLMTVFPMLSPRRRELILKNKDFFVRSLCKNGLHEYNDTNMKKSSSRGRGIVRYCVLCRKEGNERRKGIQQ